VKNIKHYIILFSIVFTTCNNTITQRKEVYISNDNIKERINTDLQKELESYMNRIYNSKYYNFIDSSVCFTLEFTQDKERVNFWAVPHEDLDPVIFISYLNCKYTPEGYKGIIRKDSFKIAIFDPDNIGNKFYDDKALEFVKVEELVCVNSEIWSLTNAVKIRGDSIAPFIFP